MQVFGLKLFNFFRFSNKNNSIVFDILPEYSGIHLDDIYDKIRKNPIEHVQKVKANGITNLMSIAGLVNGNYDFSNGVGKSTILEGITYALFEQVVRNVANTDKSEKITKAIVTNINGEYPPDVNEGWVEMIFEENDKIYVLKRGRELTKNKTDHKRILKFDCVSEKDSSHSGHRTGDSDESVYKAINTSYDLFVNSILFGQQDSGKFLSSTDSVRKEMLIELLRFDNLINGMLKKNRDNKNTKKEDIEKCNSQIMLMSENLEKKPSIESLNDHISEKENLIKECVSASEVLRGQLNSLLQSDAIKELESIKSEGSKIKLDLTSKRKDKESRTQEWTNLHADVTKSVSNKHQEIEASKLKKVEVTRKIGGVRKEIESFNMENNKKGLETIEKAKSAKPKCNDKINELLGVKEKAYGLMSSMESDIKRYSKEIDLLSSQIGSGKEEFVCDKCKSIVSRKHIESEIDKNKKEKEKIEAEISKLRDEQNKCVDDLKKLQENMEKINGWINKEGQINSNIKDFRNNEEKIKELEASLKEFDTNDKRLLNEQKELEEKKSQYLLKIEEISNVFNSEITLLETKYRGLAEKYKELEKSSTETKNKMDAIKKQIEEKSQLKSQYNFQIGSLRKEIEIMGEVKKQLIELRKKYEVEKSVFARMSVLDSCLGLEGIQVRIIQKYLPLLNVYIEEFMSLLSNGSISAKVIINDKSQIDVIIKGGSADTYKMLSGGEKTTCKLAISVGLALLSFTRCNHKAEFIALDELFGALDNSHIEMAFKLLNKLKDKFSRILVISHKKEINDRIPHRILVEKDEGMFGRSRIKEVV